MKAHALSLLLLAGCSTYLPPEKQSETRFAVGHRYEFVAELRCVRLPGLLLATRSRGYEGLTMDNGRRSWPREIRDVQPNSKDVILLSAGTIFVVEDIQHPIGESGTDVDIVAKLDSGPHRGARIDVREICDARSGWRDGSERGIWIFVRDDRFIRELP